MWQRQKFTQFFIVASYLSTLSITSQVFAEEELMRLLTTPMEREKIDKLRSWQEANVYLNKDIPEPPPYITFNGIIKRSDGNVTLWVNDAQKIQQKGFEIKVEAVEDISLPILLAKTNQVIYLKPGQTIDILNGKTLESYDKLKEEKLEPANN